MKYIFISGGVISGIGKGITTSSIGLLLKSRGYSVAPIKCDPYINVDAGTMNPIEHGEVFVLQDGSETDQDLGNYERFLNQDLSKENYTTQGQVYLSVIERERSLDFDGKCVEMIPHIPLEIIYRIEQAGRTNKADVVLIEIGGTAGEYQNMLFLEANRLLKLKYENDVIHMHVTYLPTPRSIGEMKSKPAQMSVHMLNSFGIQPDFLIARAETPIDQSRRDKLAVMCSVKSEHIIAAPDVASIYDVPLIFEQEGLTDKLLKRLQMQRGKRDLVEWKGWVSKVKKAKRTVKIGIVGKYFSTGDFTLADSYISVIESIKHAAFSQGIKPEVFWIDSSKIEKQGVKVLEGVDGIIVPGGFGGRDIEGKIMTIAYARENNVPYLGLCYGMQLACIEFARHVLGLEHAHTTEIDPNTPDPIVHVMPEQEKKLLKRDYGGTMRLGSWECLLEEGGKVRRLYGKSKINERHRHRYEYNNAYRKAMESKGLAVVGTSTDGKLVEVIELQDHPFFVGSQFHPELQSRPLRPHPLFMGFMDAAVKNRVKTKIVPAKIQPLPLQQPVSV